MVAAGTERIKAKTINAQNGFISVSFQVLNGVKAHINLTETFFYTPSPNKPSGRPRVLSTA
jgi:hypothetical protein